MKKLKKEDEYAMKIMAKIQELFDDDSEGETIDKEELMEDDNMTHFMHALSNLAPLMVYSRFTGDKNVNILSFNHIANQLVFQYANKE